MQIQGRSNLKFSVAGTSRTPVDDIQSPHLDSQHLFIEWDPN